MRFLILALRALILILPTRCVEDEADGYVYQTSPRTSTIRAAKAPRYLLYDVNPGEGFNLRLDVYARLASVVRRLNEEAPWVLVLPPWTATDHWENAEEYEHQLSWRRLFQVERLRRVVPVMELDEFLKMLTRPVIQEVYFILDPEDKKGETKVEITPCTHTGYWMHVRGRWHGRLLSARNLTCIASVMKAGFLKPFLLNHTTARSVMLDKSEDIFHDEDDSSKEYWEIQKSIVFRQELREEADLFRANFLNSTDEQDNTVYTEEYPRNNVSDTDAVKGGAYVAAHLRRRDYLHFYPERVPSVKSAARQLNKIMKKTGLTTLFISSDASSAEMKPLMSILKNYTVHRYLPKRRKIREITDAGVAIVDQWICSHARYFIGTLRSAFSFKIQQQREILGFGPDSTFNSFCGEKSEKCEQPTHWRIIHSKK